MEQKWEHEEFTCDRNDMFMEVARELLVLTEAQLKSAAFRMEC